MIRVTVEERYRKRKRSVTNEFDSEFKNFEKFLAAISRRCPECGRGEGNFCKNPDGGLLLHRERTKSPKPVITRIGMQNQCPHILRHPEGPDERCIEVEDHAGAHRFRPDQLPPSDAESCKACKHFVHNHDAAGCMVSHCTCVIPNMDGESDL